MFVVSPKHDGKDEETTYINSSVSVVGGLLEWLEKVYLGCIDGNTGL